MVLNKKSVFLTLIITIIGIIIMLVPNIFITNWTNYKPATSMPNNAFNEAIRDGYIRQPLNTFSSFAYVIAGVFIFILPIKKDNKKSIKIYENKVIKNLYAVSIIITGLGSAFLHLSLTFIGQTTDVLGMYLLSIFIILYTILNRKDDSSKIFYSSYIILNIILLFVLIYYPELRRYLFAILIFIGLITDASITKIRSDNSIKLLLLSAGILAFGFLFWIIDNNRLIFDAYSLFQGHVIWHICGALSCLTLYNYYLNDKKQLGNIKTI